MTILTIPYFISLIHLIFEITLELKNSFVLQSLIACVYLSRVLL